MKLNSNISVAVRDSDNRIISNNNVQQNNVNNINNIPSVDELKNEM